MNTTSLFVELVVIGIGAILWISLIIFALFGYDWIQTENLFSLITALPLLAMVYVLGIVSDRLIDKLFETIWGKSIRFKFFESASDYFEAKRKVITSSERMADTIEYNRSRLRICRGWAIHSLIIAIVIPFFAFSQFPLELAQKVSIFGSIAFAVLGAASYFSWKYLDKMQYLKIKEQASFLNNQN